MSLSTVDLFVNLNHSGGPDLKEFLLRKSLVSWIGGRPARTSRSSTRNLPLTYSHKHGFEVSGSCTGVSPEPRSVGASR